MTSALRSDCPLNYGLELFGDRWSLLIIRDLMFFGKRYYNEFLNSREGISTSILATRLTLLEKEGLISSTSDKDHKQKIRYHLTAKGIDLAPIIIEIGMWSDKYATNLNPHRDIILGEARKSRVEGVKKLKARLKRDQD